MSPGEWINTLKALAMLENENNITLSEWLNIADTVESFDDILSEWLREASLLGQIKK